MTCSEWADRLPDLLEGRLDEAGREALEAHAAACPSCGPILVDLRRVQELSRTLERHSPPRGSWNRLAVRLRADPQFQRAASPRLDGGRSGFSLTWLGLAAALLLTLTATLVFLQRQAATPASSVASAPAGNAETAPSVESVEQELQLAARHYEKAISDLERIANAGDSPLDPELMAELKANLAVIDRAIGDSRTALRAQPGNTVAQESLFDAFRRKVALLQDTIALMNEMRKGNQEGAARIVEGAKS
ncbi:MAG TPA: zf-HC2 domain-containing protein [Vicinamibacterales bacterium]